MPDTPAPTSARTRSTTPTTPSNSPGADASPTPPTSAPRSTPSRRQPPSLRPIRRSRSRTGRRPARCSGGAQPRHPHLPQAHRSGGEPPQRDRPLPARDPPRGGARRSSRGQRRRGDAPLAPSTPEIIGPTIPYPGDHAPRAEIARWLGRVAQRHGLPAELPVMAALVESDLRNVQGGDADSLGLFQMRVSVWDRQYPGYANQPALQARWFVDQALAVKRARLAAGDATFGRDPAGWGEWVADIERPRGAVARALRRAAGRGPPPSTGGRMGADRCLRC